jgi:hypothetical protein
MFQTEIVLFLQLFESDPLNAFFAMINSLGYSWFFMGFAIILMFGFNFRKRFYLLHILLWTAIATVFPLSMPVSRGYIVRVTYRVHR